MHPIKIKPVIHTAFGYRDPSAFFCQDIKLPSVFIIILLLSHAANLYLPWNTIRTPAIPFSLSFFVISWASPWV